MVAFGRESLDMMPRKKERLSDLQVQGDHEPLGLAVLELGLKEVGEGGQGHSGGVDHLSNDNDDEDGVGDAMISIPVITNIMMVVTEI